MRSLRFVLTIGVLILTLPPAGLGQESTVYLSAPFQIGARGIGFAGAITGDNPDVSIMYGNPAALSFLENTAIVLTHTLEKSTDVMDENVAAPLFLKRDEVVGIALSVNHVGHLSTSSKNGFKVIQYGYDVGYGRRITPALSLGGTLHVRYARSTGSKLWGLSSTFGIFYHPTPDISYGAAITGVGSGIKYIFDGTNTLLNSENISNNFLAGAAFRFPSNSPDDRLFTISLAARKNFDHPDIFYFGGVEIFPVSAVALRVGYLGAANTVEYASFGIGFIVDKWKLDIGATPSKASNQIYQVTLTTSIWDQFGKVY